MDLVWLVEIKSFASCAAKSEEILLFAVEHLTNYPSWGVCFVEAFPVSVFYTVARVVAWVVMSALILNADPDLVAYFGEQRQDVAAVENPARYRAQEIDCS